MNISIDHLKFELQKITPKILASCETRVLHELFKTKSSILMSKY